MSASIRDRTLEFQRCAMMQAKNLSLPSSNGYQPLSTQKSPTKNNKSQFTLKAQQIAKELTSTTDLLQKLATLCRRKPIFNDNPTDIAQLSFIIKRKIYVIEEEMGNLQQLSKSNINELNKNNVNGKQHYGNVMILLNSKMKNISGSFKDVLEKRQLMELENKERLGTLIPRDEKGSSSDTHVKSTYNSSNPFMSTTLSEGDSNTRLGLSQDHTQLLLQEESQSSQQQYLQDRNRAVETIESTIQEVGNIFQQLAGMVQQQHEQVQRIDENVMEVEDNINGAQAELMKYYDRISSNKWMSVKIFGTLFFFFLIWVMVN
ncbi:hypothetical protein QEN19_002828 [Hanseniaspora menglaensis]